MQSRKYNILNINYEFEKAFCNISTISNVYIENSFKLGLKLIKMKIFTHL